MHRNHPSEPVISHQRSGSDKPARRMAASRSAHNRSPIRPSPARTQSPPNGTPTPLNALAAADGPLARNPPVRHRDQARPETHQNLIHTDKEQHAPQPGRQRPRRPSAPRHAPNHQLLLRDTTPALSLGTSRQTAADRANTLPRTDTDADRPAWRRSDSNRRPPACKAGALPAELRPRRVVRRQGVRNGHR